LGRGEKRSRRVIKRIGKGVKFVGVDRVVSGGVGKIIVKGGIWWWVKIGVIFRVVNGVIGAPLDDEAPGLEERLSFVEGKSVDPGDGGVRNGEFGPAMTGNAGAGGEGEEIERSLGITGGTDGNGAHGAGVGGVGGIVVVINLGVAAKFNTHGVEIRAWLSCDKSGGAESVRDAGWPWKLVETADNVCDHVADEKFGEAAVGEAVSASAEGLLDGANGTFDFANVTIRGNDVEMDGGKSKACALKFLVPVDVNNVETADGVKVDGGLKLGDNGFGRAVGDWGNSTEADVARDCV
jgi:hypothetical protein